MRWRWWFFGRKKTSQLDDAAYDVMVDQLTLFARAGGVITWNLWTRIGTQSRAALIEAFERVKAEEAAAIGLATQGPRQAAQILSAADGGDLSCELALDEFAEKLATKK